MQDLGRFPIRISTLEGMRVKSDTYPIEVLLRDEALGIAGELGGVRGDVDNGDCSGGGGGKGREE
jgi:hypothetical protein